jgi:hypothetical protein
VLGHARADVQGRVNANSLRRKTSAKCALFQIRAPGEPGKHIVQLNNSTADFLIAVNFAEQSRSFNVGELQAQSALVRISTYLDREHERVENDFCCVSMNA